MDSRSITSAVSGSAAQSIAFNHSNVNIMILIRQERALSIIMGNYVRGIQVSMASVNDLEDTLSSISQHDYCNYITQDNKILLNSSKLLLVSVFLIKLLDQYQQPTYKVQTAAQTEFENDQRQQKFIELKHALKAKFLTITRMLYENHIIICKMILQKVQPSCSDNNWVI